MRTHQFLNPNTGDIRKPSDHPIYWIAEYISRISGVRVYHLQLPDKVKGSRKREYALPRQLSMYFANEYKIGSLEYIANYFGERDHSTAIHARDTIKGLMDTDRIFKAKVSKIATELVKIQGRQNPSVAGISKDLSYNLETYNKLML